MSPPLSYHLDGGPIRLQTSPDSDASCFSSIASFFKVRNGSMSFNQKRNVISKEYLDYLDDSDSDEFDCEVKLLEKFQNEKKFENKLPVSIIEKTDTTERLSVLRKLMIKNKIDVYIVPSEDEHLSEYTSPLDQRREYISGFTGSAGIAVITLDEAALSTDGRYFLQAANQLDNNWILLKQGIKTYPRWDQWALQKAFEGTNRSLAVDPKLITNKIGEFFKEKCFEINVEFKPIMENLIDKVKDILHYKLPPNSLPLNTEIYEFPERFAGESSNSKIEKIKEYLNKNKSFAIIVSALDDIAWLFNLRGNDIPYNPVFFAYAVVSIYDVYLYVDIKKISKKTLNYLNNKIDKLNLININLFWNDLETLKSPNLDINKIILSPSSSYALNMTIPPTINSIIYSNLITELKSIKNSIEIKNHKYAQLKDGIALCRFFAWLNKKNKENKKINEIEAANRATFYRSLLSDFKGLSFETISSTGKNASIIHYSPTPDNFSEIDFNNIYLLDSGSQYLDGTTDITRTIHFNKPKELEIKAYTLVLKGHLQVAMARFPPDTPSVALDALARGPLWSEGMEYKHGSGHGIGTFLNVHEGPCGIGSTTYGYKPLEPGNFISDEPGYYKDNEFGVRIESDILVVKSDKNDDGLNLFYEFEYLTRVPFCKKLIDIKWLNKDQIKWINDYYIVLRNELIPHLEEFGDKDAINWLLYETEPLPFN